MNRLRTIGALCLMLLITIAAKAQGDVTVLWDFKNNIPEGINAATAIEKCLYSTNFTEWGNYETKAEETETTVTWQTKYSHEDITFSIFNTQIGATNFNTGKFPDWEGGFLMAAKSANPYITTSALASITKVHYMHGATGSNRGWKLEAKGDGDED